VAVLGLILLVAAGVLTAAVVTSNTGAIETDLWGTTISNLSLGAVFVAGMLTTLVGVAGLVLLTAALRRGRRLRQERRVLRRENERLAQQVGGASLAETAPSHGVWRRRSEPPDRTADPASAGPASAGPAAGTAPSGPGATRRYDREPTETALPPAAGAEERPADGSDRSTPARRARATSDSGS
jgi:hypothetical protein